MIAPYESEERNRTAQGRNAPPGKLTFLDRPDVTRLGDRDHQAERDDEEHRRAEERRRRAADRTSRPRGRPSAIATVGARPQMPIASPRRAAGARSATRDEIAVVANPQPTPCTARRARSQAREAASGSVAVAAAKRARPPRAKGRRPLRSSAPAERTRVATAAIDERPMTSPTSLFDAPRAAA